MSEQGERREMIDAADVAVCLRVLGKLGDDPGLCDADALLARVRDHAARLVRACRQLARSEAQARDREVLDSTGIRQPAQAHAVMPELTASRRCYVCGQPFTRPHFFYDSLCPPCAEHNHARREQTADLSGRVALVTGARVKIGYQVALKLLRAGARVLATTRFPRDAARRYAAEPDFEQWADRLAILALDLRALVALESFAAVVGALVDRLDVLINNAAQTVRRPEAYYRTLREGECVQSALPRGADRLFAGPPAGTPAPLLPGPIADSALFPAGAVDAFGRQIDLREHTSWTLDLPEVELIELVEVHAINCLAPFELLRRLDGLLMRHPEVARYIVNVSSMEGNFTADRGKTGKHPHTNMAKAAMNMITRTCAEGYARRGIWMNSVDPGWVSNEAPTPAAEAMAQAGFREPLDLIDAAARVLDPVFVGVSTGHNVFGKLFKDYREVSW
jgi:NAD(P)-dependent dehydrogenase (short-subunit alcohol dehydrogenase family)